MNNQAELDFSQTVFHGKTYNEELDKERFTKQLKRIYETLQDGKEYTSTALCEKANVSFSAVRNRISDLRVYHACKIKSSRINRGLWKYQFIGRYSPEEHQAYLSKLSNKRTRAVERKLTNLEILCFVLGQQGGTVHQVARDLSVTANEILEADYEKMQELCRAAQKVKRNQPTES